jgi:hypothetical protein
MLPNIAFSALQITPDCPFDKACIREKCVDPCEGACGYNTRCVVNNHQPQCFCVEGYVGDPFSGCSPKPIEPPPRLVEERLDPCNPSPCGDNARCTERNGAGACTCLPEYFGDPYTGCRPECLLNQDCPQTRACVRNKCVDPCPGKI